MVLMCGYSHTFILILGDTHRLTLYYPECCITSQLGKASVPCFNNHN